MTEVAVITSWLNEGETYIHLYRTGEPMVQQRDVCFVNSLGRPTEENVAFFCRAYGIAEKRLVVTGVVKPCEWVEHFNKVNAEFMEIDENTFIFNKEF